MGVHKERIDNGYNNTDLNGFRLVMTFEREHNATFTVKRDYNENPTRYCCGTSTEGESGFTQHFSVVPLIAVKREVDEYDRI